MGRSLTSRESCYSRLRSLGVSVEVADEKAPILAGLTERQREAVFYTIEGFSQREIAGFLGCNHSTVCRDLKQCTKTYSYSLYSSRMSADGKSIVL